MNISLLRTNKEITDMYIKYVDTVYKIALVMLKNIPEAEDATQTVFVKLIKYQNSFASGEHQKAWLIVTTQNTCKDMLKGWWQSKRTDFEKIPPKSYLPPDIEVIFGGKLWDCMKNINCLFISIITRGILLWKFQIYLKSTMRPYEPACVRQEPN